MEKPGYMPSVRAKVCPQSSLAGVTVLHLQFAIWAAHLHSLLLPGRWEFEVRCQAS